MFLLPVIFECAFCFVLVLDSVILCIYCWGKPAEKWEKQMVEMKRPQTTHD